MDKHGKQLILTVIIGLSLLIPACLKIFDWINDIGLVEFSIYLVISVVSIISYKLFVWLDN